jgi:hypothetical protein
MTRMRADMATIQRWQPISTAPNGWILGYVPDSLPEDSPCVAVKRGPGGWWRAGDRKLVVPTLWQPLPATPVGG